MNKSILTLFIITLFIGCGDDDSTSTTNTDDLLVKSISIGTTNCELEYNNQNQLIKFSCYSEIYLGQTPNGIFEYATYEYDGLNLSKIFHYEAEFDNNGNITGNIYLEYKEEYTIFNSSEAKAIKTYYDEDDGSVRSTNQIEYTFQNDLIKSYKVYYDYGGLADIEYTHNSQGNLTKEKDSFYNPDGSLRRVYEKKFSDWDSGKKASEFMGIYNELGFLPGKLHSNSNYLNCIYSNGSEDRYQYEYNDQNYPTLIKFSDSYILKIEY